MRALLLQKNRATHHRMASQAHWKPRWIPAFALLSCIAVIIPGTVRSEEQTEALQAGAPIVSALQEAAIHSMNEQYAEAEACYREAMGTVGADCSAALNTALLLANAIDKQGQRQQEAAQVLVDALAKCEAGLGQDHAVVKRAREKALSICRWIAWTKSTQANASQEDWEAALKAAEQANSLDTENAWWWMVAFCRAGLCDADGARQAMAESLGRRDVEDWIGQWFVAATVARVSGNEEAARDWYCAASDRLVGTGNTWEPNLTLQTRLAAQLGYDPVWPPAGWSDEQCLAALDRLIASHPDVLNLRVGRCMARYRLHDWNGMIHDSSDVCERISARLAAEPDNADLRTLRADMHARLEQWQKAADDLLACTEAESADSFAWLRTAPVVALTGNQDAYKQFCERMIERYRSSDSNEEIERTIKSSLLIPGVIDSSQLPIDRLRRAMEGEGMEPWKLGWGWACLALTELRGGDPLKALQYLRHAAREEDYATSPVEQSLCLMLKTIAHQRLDQQAEARDSYEQALALHQPKMAGAYEHDVLITELVRREAEAGFAGIEQEAPSLVEPYIKTFAGRWVCETEADEDIEGYMKKGEIVRMVSVQTPLADRSGLQSAWHLEKDGVVRGRSHTIAVWDPASKSIKASGSATGGFFVTSESKKVDGKWVDRSTLVYPDAAHATATSTVTISDNGNTHSFLVTERVDCQGNPLPDRTDVWKRVSRNHEELEKCLGWMLGVWEDEELTGGFSAKWIANQDVIQLDWYNPDANGVSLIVWDSSDGQVKMRGAGSDASNGEATLTMEGKEAIWRNVVFDAEGRSTVSHFRMVPDDNTTCCLKFSDEGSGEERVIRLTRKTGP